MENLSFVEPLLPPDTSRSHVVVFTSGKGGVGKTSITTNVATAMAERGARVCIFDADTGLANINILLGLRPEYTLEHVLNGEKTISEILITTEYGVTVVPGASGVAELANLDTSQAKRLYSALTELEADYDYFLIDTAAGIAANVLHFIESAPHTFLLITPEPTSLTDAFSVLKILNNRHYNGRLRVVVNMADDYPHATETYRRFAAAVEKYLTLKVEYGGFVARDENLPRSVMQQTPVVDLIPNAPASRCLFALADNLLKYIGSTDSETGLADYWQNFLQENTAEQAGAEDDSPISLSHPEPHDHPIKPADFTDIADQLLSSIHDQATDKPTLEAFNTDFIEHFLAQFGHFPDNFRQLLFRWLESENYEATKLQELAGTLEMLYMARHQQPMHSIENSVARLIAQCQGSETQMRGSVKQLRAAYQQAFQVDAIDARAELLESIRKPNFSEEDYQQLLEDLGQAFQSRFKRPYQGQSDVLLESATETLAEIAVDENNLQEQIETLTNSFQQLSLRRAALLSAISKSRNDSKQAFHPQNSFKD